MKEYHIQTDLERKKTPNIKIVLTDKRFKR